MSKSIVMLLLLILIPTIVVSQAMYVDAGNAISVLGSYDSESNSDGKTTTLSGTGIYTISGIFDIGVGVGIANLKDDSDDYFDLSGTELDFGAFYNHKSEELPFNVKVGGAYGSGSFSGDVLDDLDWEVTFKLSQFGGGVYKNILKSDTYQIIPFADFWVVNVETTIEDTYYNDSDSDSDSFNSFNFGVGILMSSGLILEPSVSQTDGETEINLSIGYLLPL